MKIAIFNYAENGANQGGPSGYLDNLFKGLANYENKPDFFFVEKNHAGQKKATTSQMEMRFCTIRSLLYFFKMSFKTKKVYREKMKGYNVIHVHSLIDLYNLRVVCRYDGMLILTPHHPEPFADEKIGALRAIRNGRYRLLWKFYNYIQIKAFQYADGYIFPSEGAMIIYHKFDGFSKAVKNKPIEYVYTGVKEQIISIDKITYRKKQNIPENAFVATYIGRHNMIKGYDRILNIFEEGKKNGIQFVIAGAPSDMEYPQDPSWIELGKIGDVPNLINSSDVVIIPNRNTYFDLIIIEALSIGKVVITSDTGGNNDIAQKTRGMILFDNNNETTLWEQLYEFKNLSTEKRTMLEMDAKAFYQDNCTLDDFAKGYLIALEKVCENR